jgi:hypothetical protein
MGSFSGKKFVLSSPPEQMGSFCVFLSLDNSIGSDYEAGMVWRRQMRRSELRWYPLIAPLFTALPPRFAGS